MYYTLHHEESPKSHKVARFRKTVNLTYKEFQTVELRLFGKYLCKLDNILSIRNTPYVRPWIENSFIYQGYNYQDIFKKVVPVLN
jgi:hypothetical protein